VKMEVSINVNIYMCAEVDSFGRRASESECECARKWKYFSEQRCCFGGGGGIN